MKRSTILFLRPDLVSPAYKNTPPLPARDQKHRVEIAKADGWPGYWGSPRLATAAAGAAQLKSLSSRWIDLALKILDGFDYRQMKRLGDEIPPSTEPSVDGKTFRQQNQEIERKQREWLKQKGLESIAVQNNLDFESRIPENNGLGRVKRVCRLRLSIACCPTPWPVHLINIICSPVVARMGTLNGASSQAHKSR